MGNPIEDVDESGGRARVDAKGYLQGPPELVVEIASSTASLDAREKFASYRRSGMPEYLLWRIEDEAIDWWVLEEDEYRPISGPGETILRSRVFPGLWLDIAALRAGNAAQVISSLQSGLASKEHATFVAELLNRDTRSGQIGDYYQFQVSTLGFSGLQFSLDQTGSFGGVTNVTFFAYSLDGISFTTVNNNVVVVPGVTWNSTTRNTACITSFDLSHVTQLDTQSDVYLRVSANIPPFANANGTWTIDNVSLSGIQVPEPRSLVLLGGPMLVLLLRSRKAQRI